MTKQEFTQIVNEGLNRNKNFMLLKLKSEKDVNPRIIVIQGADIVPTMKKYMKITDKDMNIRNTTDYRIVIVEDVLLTSNLNDLSWFVY